MSVREPIKLKDLLDEGAVFDVDLSQTSVPEEDGLTDIAYNEALANFVNFQVAGDDLQDEDSYADSQPFEIIASKMENLLEDGKIKKRIMREGYGEKPADRAIAKVHYNAYIEYNAEPFDSTYARGKLHQFSVNCGEVILGLDIAVQSMKLNEKSQFLIHSDFAYGKLGCLARVPANSEVLFEIELIEIINAGAATTFQNLPAEEQKKFNYVYDYCLALCAKGKDLFGKNIIAAIREYNTAVAKLEMARMDNYEEEMKQQNLLFRLYTNLLVCYTKIEEPKKGCINFNKINELVRGTDIKITAKCYYNNAKCLRMLGDYNLAKKRLERAYKMEPNNNNIVTEMISLEDEVKKYKKKEIELGKAFVNSCK